MARLRIKPKFRSQLCEKLMELGNLVAAILVLGQFVSNKEFSVVIFISGIILMSVCYIASYVLSL